MDDAKVITFETTQPIFSEMKRQMPRMASMLGTKADELLILSYDWIPHEYMESKFRDKIVKTDGVLDGLPHIQIRRQNVSGKVGYGIYVYQSYMHKTLKYIVYCVKGPHWDENYLVIPKGQLYRFKRTAIQLNKLCSKNLKSPILEEGMLEEVVQNTIGFLIKAKNIEKYGVKIKRGIILDGPPGNGKTMLCRYIQKLCSLNGIRWGIITSADIDQAYNDKELNNLFTRWPVSFFDDIDVGYMDRTKGSGKMACALLTAMDGMYESGHLVRIFTTNEEVNGLDKAFTRPGRIDKFITFKKPHNDLRRRLIETWPEEMCSNICIDEAVEKSNGYSFAEVEAIRTHLVSNKVLGDGTWDLEAAFAELNERQEESKSIKLGIKAAEKKKKKRKKSNKTGKDIIKKGGEQSPCMPCDFTVSNVGVK